MNKQNQLLICFFLFSVLCFQHETFIFYSTIDFSFFVASNSLQINSKRLSVSPAELNGDDDNAEKQIDAFVENIRTKHSSKQFQQGTHYTKCGCKRFQGMQMKSKKVHLNYTVLYVHIPKTGGTSIERQLDFGGSCHAKAADFYRCDPKQYNSSLTLGKIYASFRHPVSRAISAYQYALRGGNGSDRDKEKFAWVRNITFSSFIKSLDQKIDAVNFAPQNSFIKNSGGGLMVNKLLCTEALNLTWNTELGMSFGNLTEKLRANPQSNVPLVTQEDVAILQNLYHEDFILWKQYCQPTSEGVISKPETIQFADSSPNKRIIWFLHFHKAAGSSFTDLAGMNYESKILDSNVRRQHSHIELGGDGALRWPLILNNRSNIPRGCFGDDRNITPIHWKEEMMQNLHNGITFVSSEHYFPRLSPNDLIRPEVKFVTILRDPSDRLLSSYYFHRCSSRCQPKFGKKQPCRLIDWAPMEANMYTRLLNGYPYGPNKMSKECSHAFSALPVNRNHRDFALKSLSQFDLVLTLPSFEVQPEAVKCALNRVLGWNFLDMPLENKKRMRKCPEGSGVPRQHDEWELDEVMKMNYADLELYKQGAVMERRLFEKLGCV